MPVPEHLRIVLRGQTGDSPEIWSVSLKYDWQVLGGETVDLSNIGNDGIRNACIAFFGNTRFSVNTIVQEWRAYHIGADGLMVGNPRVELWEAADYVQGLSQSVMPPQVSVCVTSVAANRGPARFGRFYLPNPANDLPIAGTRMTAGTALAWAEAASTWVKSISGAVDVPDTIQNVPLINVSALAGGVEQEVDHLSVGRVYDTQRRRRNALDEDAQVTGTIDW